MQKDSFNRRGNGSKLRASSVSQSRSKSKSNKTCLRLFSWETKYQRTIFDFVDKNAKGNDLSAQPKHEDRTTTMDTTAFEDSIVEDSNTSRTVANHSISNLDTSSFCNVSQEVTDDHSYDADIDSKPQKYMGLSIKAHRNEAQNSTTTTTGKCNVFTETYHGSKPFQAVNPLNNADINLEPENERDLSTKTHVNKAQIVTTGKRDFFSGKSQLLDELVTIPKELKCNERTLTGPYSSLRGEERPIQSLIEDKYSHYPTLDLDTLFNTRLCHSICIHRSC